MYCIWIFSTRIFLDFVQVFISIKGVIKKVVLSVDRFLAEDNYYSKTVSAPKVFIWGHLMFKVVFYTSKSLNLNADIDLSQTLSNLSADFMCCQPWCLLPYCVLQPAERGEGEAQLGIELWAYDFNRAS